jgi:hypothetical protein
MAYDILALPPLTDLKAWASREWRDCDSGPVKPVGAAPVPAPGAGSGGAGTPSGAGGPPPALGALAAFIASPRDVVPTGGNATVRVDLDATGSQAAPLRPILMYTWSVKRLPDQLQVAATGGRSTSVWLHPGVYAVTLTVTDLMGASASAGRVFAVWPVEKTTAVIGQPPAFVPVELGDATQVGRRPGC